MKQTIQKRVIAVFSAVALGACMFTGTPSRKAKAEYLNSVTIAVDEEIENLNLLTRTEGSYAADMVHTMVCDRLFTLGAGGGFTSDLIESWQMVEGEGGYGELLDYPDEIISAPGWKEQPNFEEDIYSMFDSTASVICTLHEGVRFHDGSEFTAHSLVELVNFARAQSPDTLIYRTWAPVTISVIDDYTFSFWIDTEHYGVGFMDVIYGLASPQGGIVAAGEGYDENEYPIGTGAYKIVEINNSLSVRLERSDDWWRSETVSTEYVTFQYISDNTFACAYLQYGECDVAFVRDTDEIEEFLWQHDEAFDVEWLDGNPLALFFNTNTPSIFRNNDYRRAATLALEKNIIWELGELERYSWDFWCYIEDDDPSLDEEDELGYARDLIADAGYLIGFYEINVIRYDQSYFSNSTYWQYYDIVCNKVKEDLEALFGYYNVNVNMTSVSEATMEELEASGSYDIMLKEIDLHDVNSARNALYGKGSTQIDEWLNHALHATDKNTYMLTHLAAQHYNYTDEMYVTNLGWQERAMICDENVSGVSYVNSFCPIGNSSTVDFRFIAVTAN